MRQEINLHQPMFRKAQTLFSARVSLRIGVVVLGALVLIYGVTFTRVQFVAADLRSLESKRDAAQRRLEQASAQLTGAGHEDLLSEVETLRHELEVKQATQAVVSRGEIGDSTGFTGHFVAFGRQRVNGLWLTHVELTAGGEELALQGRLQDERLLPRYLERLAREPVLKGVEFGQTEVSREGEGTPTFGLRTSRVGSGK